MKRYPFNEPLKAAIWLYFILLIFEGALRKWVFPALSTPILLFVIRLPSGYLSQARQKGYLKFNPYSFFMVFVGFISTIYCDDHWTWKPVCCHIWRKDSMCCRSL